MKPKNEEEQLREFFSHHPVEDPLYLKRYVKEHPGNKMAWYLLGREYASKGKDGKALYCFTQAGEVYEAFEKQAAPILIDPLLDEKRKAWERRRRRRTIRGVAALVLSLAALLYITSPEEHEARQNELAEAPKPAATATAQETDKAGAPLKYYYMVKPKSKANVGTALQDMLTAEKKNGLSILVQSPATADGRWIQWAKKPAPLLSVQGKPDAAQQNIQYFDAESCDCKPNAPAAPLTEFASWTAKQEQGAVLRSALAAYYKLNGVMPESIQDVNRPYPNNMLPGLTPYMTELYERNKSALQDEAKALQAPPQGSAPAAEGTAAKQAAAASTEPLAEPLRIIVDKKKHRLALVSGAVMVRNYPIGLGGDRTPEGEFAITEKVRNPNGKSNGDFGSRGMTLSDTLYAIHGTNKPSSIGKDQSLGCIRMLQEDVEELFDMVPLGTKVTIGSGLLPEDIIKSGKPFQLPLFVEETNPNKVYKWLD